MLKKVVIWICTLSLLMGTCLAAPEVKAPNCLLMDRATGEVLYEKNADERLAPASVTKVMTLLLVMEAIDRGQLHWEDTITASAAAAAKGAVRSIWKRGSRCLCGRWSNAWWYPRPTTAPQHWQKQWPEAKAGLWRK